MGKERRSRGITKNVMFYSFLFLFSFRRGEKGDDGEGIKKIRTTYEGLEPSATMAELIEAAAVTHWRIGWSPSQGETRRINGNVRFVSFPEAFCTDLVQLVALTI